MQISLSDNLFSFAVALASHARLFTLAQLAKHPDLSWRSLPQKRAAEVLRLHSDYFDKIPWRYGKPFIYRLSNKAKREYGLNFKSIDASSSKAEHWLSFGDLWMALTFAAGRPDVFIAEPKDSAGFDIFCAWMGTAYLFEIQRTPLSKKEWKKKWESRLEWYKKEGWRESPWQRTDYFVVPQPVLITSQPLDKIVIPSNCIYAKCPEDFVHKIQRKKLAQQI